MRKLLLLLALISPAFADDLADFKQTFEQADKALVKNYITNDELSAIKDKIAPATDKINEILRKIEPELEDARERVKALTPEKPVEGKPAPPPETDEVKREREKQVKGEAEINATVQQYKSLLVRSEQILQKVTDHKRRMFTAQVFEVGPALLSPQFWGEIVESVPYAARSLSYLAQEQVQAVGFSGIFTSGFLALLIVGFWYFLRKALTHSLIIQHLTVEDTQSERVGSLFLIFFQKSLPFFVAVFAGLMIGEMTGLLIPRLKPVTNALIIASGVVAVLKGLCDAVIARQTSLRLVQLNDQAAFALVGLIRGVGRTIAITMVVLALLKVLYAPLVLTALTTQLMSLYVVFQIFRFLLSDKSEDLGKLAVLRPFLWIIIALLAIALLMGYSAFSSYLITRCVLAAFVMMVGRLLFSLLNALFGDLFEQNGKHSGRIARNLGISPMHLELAGALLKGAMQLFVIMIGLMVIMGPWGMQTGDYSARLDDSVFGFRLGDVRHSLWLIAGALVIFIGGVSLTRSLRGWLSGKILPLTSTDTGLQNSFSTILSYAGFVAAFFAGLNFLGVSLGSVTILAGALSVGIGFGLQSIVSNFVSGLILLAERPIRVGDSINVKGEEGRVRKISVRSTEIETFERSTVIIPNSELISGVVKNWTHSNRQARITVAIRVAYDSDVDLVMDELILAAKSVKSVQKDPVPKVYLAHLKDNGLEFELRVVILNVDHILNAKSDLNLAVLRRLNAAGIIVAPPEQRVQTKKPSDD
jgi:potassium-dependent mechanosensitive channel